VTGLELQATMGKREFDDLCHLRHGPVNRGHPGQRAHREPLATGVQAAHQWLGHDRVADPLRSDDQ
jgi:hypothetical protein